MSTTLLRHNRARLALHVVRPAIDESARPLLVLHGLGESTPDDAPAWAAAWQGPVVGLDFTGHGRSTLPAGGGYSAEILVGDADVALAHLGEATVVGRGIGAYVALMLAGARPAQVHGTVLCDGPGLAGGATGPTSQSVVVLAPRSSPPDPYALLELSRDLRPPDYAAMFARLAVEGSGLDEPITVTALVRPAWLAAVVEEVGVGTAPSIPEALARYAVHGR